jgi:hypothetical protein
LSLYSEGVRQLGDLEERLERKTGTSGDICNGIVMLMRLVEVVMSCHYRTVQALLPSFVSLRA